MSRLSVKSYGTPSVQLHFKKGISIDVHANAGIWFQCRESVATQVSLNKSLIYIKLKVLFKEPRYNIQPY